MSTDSENHAFREGAIAGKEGLETNPYTPLTDESTAWEEGWLEANGYSLADEHDDSDIMIIEQVDAIDPATLSDTWPFKREATPPPVKKETFIPCADDPTVTEIATLTTTTSQSTSGFQKFLNSLTAMKNSLK